MISKERLTQIGTSIFMLFYILVIFGVLVFIFIMYLEIDKQRMFCQSNNGDYMGYEYKTGQCLIENGNLYEFYYINKVNGKYVFVEKSKNGN